jgi:hypothetical protein
VNPAKPQRSARVPPALTWKRPGQPTGWGRVLEKRPEGAIAEPGYVCLEMQGKVRHVPARELELTDPPPI